ncbi:methyltransferase [Desulfoluna sp.]|uniref:tRNA1(Val) (adenine(37)-N6)-methyltransferase n=1 Tax=Desulfoluna sp. TaxID=2045199 RepID=UPI002624BAA7|nr:methyltransferase [Desulfoluna sp.]
MVPSDLTADTLFDGELVLFQEKRGYRFSIDSVLLAHFAEMTGAVSLLDLGCGCGVMPLVLARRHPGLVRVVGVELQAALAHLAEKNRVENGLTDRLTILHTDMRHCTQPYEGGPFDRVVSNPPYTPLGRGRLNPRDQKAIARHEVALSLSELLDAARLNLSPTGMFSMVYPAERLEEVMATASRKKFHPGRLRMVHSHAGAPPKRLLLSLSICPISHHILPPLVVHEPHGPFTDEVDKMFKK